MIVGGSADLALKIFQFRNILGKIRTDSKICKITWIMHHSLLIFGRFVSVDQLQFLVS